MIWIKGILVFFYLLLESFLDLKKRKISLIGVFSASVLGIVLNCLSGSFSFYELLLGLLPGAFLIISAIISEGRVGYGDGFIILGLGMILGCRKTVFVLFMGLLLCAICAAGSLIIGKANRKTSLPFVPFFIVPGIVVFFLTN